MCIRFFMLKNLFNFISIFLLFTSNILAATFSDFNVEGNKRVSSQTIINFSKLKEGTDLSKNEINEALKNIYETNFFEEVEVNITNNTLNIIVKEYPIIQDIEFKGIEAKKFIKLLEENLTLKSKSSFNKFLLQNDLNNISNILRKLGYYFAKVDVQQKLNSNNTINLIYDVDMGEKALISEIKFIGNKKFKSSKLLKIIKSEENKFWKFLSKRKYLDKERTNLDKRLLKNFYLDRGYYQVNIEDVYTKILDGKSFSLTYKIDANRKFLFNTFKILMPDDYNSSDFDELRKVFNNLKNSTYSYRGIESILDEIDKIATIENYEFIDVAVTETIENDNKLNFVFNIKEGDQYYIEKINIVGNNITNEAFIRQQILTDEGDPLNKMLYNKTVNKIRSKNVFKSVKSEIVDGSTKGLKIVNIIVEEKPTGEITAGAGYGTSGSTIAVGIKENNFSGKGIKLDANVSISADSIRGKFSYTNPNFAYSDRSLTTTLQSVSIDKEENFGYKTSINRISLGTSFEQFENVYFAPSFSVSLEELTTTANASVNYKKQEGSYFDTLFNYAVSYDRLNSQYRPTDGFISTFSQELPLISDNTYMVINGYQIKKYKEIMDDAVLSIGFFTRAANTLGTSQDVRVSKRLFLPENKLRGFEKGKVGPKDGPDYVGGNYMASFNTSMTLPFLFPSYDNADFSIFFDAANVWHVDYSRQVDQGNSIRSSTGLAIDVITPVGPLSFSLTQPITKADGDQTETLRFNLGTTF